MGSFILNVDDFERDPYSAAVSTIIGTVRYIAETRLEGSMNDRECAILAAVASVLVASDPAVLDMH